VIAATIDDHAPALRNCTTGFPLSSEDRRPMSAYCK
jgi:hypothetical protein